MDEKVWSEKVLKKVQVKTQVTFFPESYLKISKQKCGEEQCCVTTAFAITEYVGYHLGVITHWL